MTISNKSKLISVKFLGLFSAIRFYNIVLLAMAQITCSVYFFSDNNSFYLVLTDLNIWFIIISTATSISAGYIINNFFDLDKDLINRPIKTIFEEEVSIKTKMIVFISLNFLCLIFAQLVSFRAFIFFLFYMLSIFIYSIKISKYPFIGNLLSVLLSITPFFAVTLYYKNFNDEIFLHALYLFLIVMLKDLIKDLISLRGDFTMNYKTITVVYGEKITKFYMSLISPLIILVSLTIVNLYQLSYMKYYYFFSIFFIVAFTVILWKKNDIVNYQKLHNAIRLLIVLGLLSIPLYEQNV